MSAVPDLTMTMTPLDLSVTPIYGNSGMTENVTSCQEWEKTHHLLFHLGNLSLVVGLLIPTTVGLHMILLRLLLMTGQFECTLLANIDTQTHTQTPPPPPPAWSFVDMFLLQSLQM